MIVLFNSLLALFTRRKSYATPLKDISYACLATFYDLQCAASDERASEGTGPTFIHLRDRFLVWIEGTCDEDRGLLKSLALDFEAQETPQLLEQVIGHLDRILTLQRKLKSMFDEDCDDYRSPDVVPLSPTLKHWWDLPEPPRLDLHREIEALIELRPQLRNGSSKSQKARFEEWVSQGNAEKERAAAAHCERDEDLCNGSRDSWNSVQPTASRRNAPFDISNKQYVDMIPHQRYFQKLQDQERWRKWGQHSLNTPGPAGQDSLSTEGSPAL